MRAASSLIRRAGITSATLGLAAAVALVAAPSASASPTVTGTLTDNGNGSITIVWSGASTSNLRGISFCAAGATPCATAPGSATYEALRSLASGTQTYSAVSSVVDLSSNTSTVLPAGVYRVEFKDLDVSGSPTYTLIHALQSVQISVVTPSTPPSSTGESTPVPASMSLGEGAGGAQCKVESPTGYTGTWMALPGQSDCHKADAPKATLLGWSTSAAFPVAIAQRQADNKWGVYEVRDADGTLTAVFIPAGWDAFVTGSNTLFPIWAQ